MCCPPTPQEPHYAALADHHNNLALAVLIALQAAVLFLIGGLHVACRNIRRRFQPSTMPMAGFEKAGPSLHQILERQRAVYVSVSAL